MPLVFVPTPLGNLRDITVRALDTLRESELLVAEDTRVARKLLAALKLPSKPLRSYREQNAAAATEPILEQARKSLVAVVCDAGTPGISDPGTQLIAAARRNDIAVSVLPGPSAVLGAVVLSGFEVREFTFAGFLPRTRSARQTAFLHSAQRGIGPTVWFESPHRIHAALRDLATVAPDRLCFVLREYTKLHEQQIVGTAGEVATALREPVRGEIVLVVEAERRKPEPRKNFERAADELIGKNQSSAAIAKALAHRGYGARRDLYARIVERKR